MLMYQEERLAAIAERVRRDGRIAVPDICRLFEVSRDTARRDLVRLEEEGAVVRTRGGAVLPTLTKAFHSYKQRLETGTAEKRAIGLRAAELIAPGDYIILDSSTTVQYAAEQARFENNVVVTNSIDIAGVLSEKSGVTVHLLGGVLNPEHRYAYGARAVETLGDYRVDTLFLGACGITAEGLTNPFEEEGYLLKKMMERADRVVVLADHSKFGKRAFHRVSGFERIDKLITDCIPEREIRQALEEHEVEVIFTGGDGE